MRRIYKTESSVGARTHDWKTLDKTAFETMIRWKREKFAATGKYDVLSAGWTLELLRILWAEGYGDLKCDLHALYFGGRLACTDFGLVEGSVFHGWMTGYETDFRSLSPGIQLLEDFTSAAQDLGYTWLDMGVGIEGYKGYYASEPVTVLDGFISTRSLAANASKVYGAIEHAGDNWAMQGHKLSKAGRLPGMMRRRYSQIAACNPSFSGRSKAMLQAVKLNL